MDQPKELDESFLQVVNVNSDIPKIINYIVDNFVINFEMEEIKDIATKLIKEKGYSLSSIKQGYANNDIKEMIYIKKMEKNSVKEEDEEIKYEKADIKEKTSTKKTFIYAILIALSLTSLIESSKLLVKQTNYNKEMDEIDENLAILAGYNNGNIVNQHKFMSSKDSKTGKILYAYESDKIANDIIEICKNDPELLDITMANVYFNLENRLDSMENILHWLKLILRKETDMQYLYQKVANYDSFIEYLLDLGLIEKDSKEYKKYIEVNEKYKNTASFNDLDEENQKDIEKLIKKYENKKRELDDLYSIKLHNLNQSNYR